MTTEELLRRIELAGGRLTIENGRLRARVPEELLPEVRTRKEELIAMLAAKSPNLPDSPKRWPPLPRYLLAEMQRLGVSDSEKLIRIAWFNSTANGFQRRELKA